MPEHDESVDEPQTRSDDIPPPTGTLFFVTIYLMVTAGMWGAIYVLMLQR